MHSSLTHHQFKVINRHGTSLLKCQVGLTAAGLLLCAQPISADPQKGTHSPWPNTIPIGVLGFQPEGIERGRGQEFFVSGASYQTRFGAGISPHAGAIYKGNLLTGEVWNLVPATGIPAAGLSYDARTDYLYAVSASFGRGVIVYDATTGEEIRTYSFTDPADPLAPMVINDLLVTRQAVYCTDSVNPVLYEILLGPGGRLPETPQVNKLFLSPEFVMIPGKFNANGLVGDFGGQQLIVVNISSGVLYLVETADGQATPITIEGAEQLFANGDGLYLEGRTLYICQNFLEKIAVVQLSGDLTQGIFVKNLESPVLQVPTTITGFADGIYAINTHFWEIAADPFNVQTLTEVVRLPQ